MNNSIYRIIKGSKLHNFSGAKPSSEDLRSLNVSDFIEQLTLADNLEALHAVCSKIGRRYGYDYYAILVRFNRASGPPVCVQMREYANDWSDHYEKNRFIFYDPTVRIATSSLTPFLWSSRTYKQQLEDKIFDHEMSVTNDAIDFGMTDVFCAPFISSPGSYGLVRFVNASGTHWSPSSTDFFRRDIPDVYLLSSYVFESVMRIFGSKLDFEIELTEREKDVLSFTASGKNPAQISDILRISTNTITKHLSNIRNKLNTINTTHAVSKATLLGLID